MLFNVTVTPDSGLWKNASFEFEAKVPKAYPHEPPKVRCVTPIYHPNIDWEGAVCLNILRKDWKPVLDLNAVIYGLIMLFYEPNANDPLNHGEPRQATTPPSLRAAQAGIPSPPQRAPNEMPFSLLSPYFCAQRLPTSCAGAGRRLSGTSAWRSPDAPSGGTASPASADELRARREFAACVFSGGGGTMQALGPFRNTAPDHTRRRAAPPASSGRGPAPSSPPPLRRHASLAALAAAARSRTYPSPTVPASSSTRTLSLAPVAMPRTSSSRPPTSASRASFPASSCGGGRGEKSYRGNLSRPLRHGARTKVGRRPV